jgi:hypothetical protein
MTRRSDGRLGLPVSGIVAAILVSAGVLLWMFVSRGLLIVAGVGAFGPGILRELGVLKDQDEFQREAARRAGYHAYLVGGLAAIVVLSAIEWGGGAIDESAEWIRLIVVVLWLTWLSSMLLGFWGARTTAFRVLATFGAFWAVFVIASAISEASIPSSGAELVEALTGALMGTLVVAPFFVLAWTAQRWPRPTGLALLGISVLFLFLFGGRSQLQVSTVALTNTLLAGPLIVCGLALLLDWGSQEFEEESP